MQGEEQATIPTATMTETQDPHAGYRKIPYLQNVYIAKTTAISMIILSGLACIAVGIAVFFISQRQNRQNGFWGTITLNLQTQTITTDSDDSVLLANKDIPITVGINIKGLNTQGLEKIEWFYADAHNKKKEEQIERTSFETPQYFAIPRSGGDYLVGATIYYKDGKTIKTTDSFGQTMITIWPNTSKKQPIASLSSDKEKVSLNEEVHFTVYTKIQDTDLMPKFETAKKILRDFDGDGKRDRTTTANNTQYRYAQSHGIFQYHPKIAVLYDGLTGNAEGTSISLK